MGAPISNCLSSKEKKYKKSKENFTISMELEFYFNPQFGQQGNMRMTSHHYIYNAITHTIKY